MANSSDDVRFHRRVRRIRPKLTRRLRLLPRSYMHPFFYASLSSTNTPRIYPLFMYSFLYKNDMLSRLLSCSRVLASTAIHHFPTHKTTQNPVFYKFYSIP
ncbi:Uncharacterized protein Fot_50770 [Forsythia ovata]|uniref:Uncharacterized protein n=1 Tax=Forsythia ovata TaxID=205694 RepID=A0ABD1Q209_9LAMI